MRSHPPGVMVALLTHARHVPAAERTRFASRLRSELGGDALVLETCHRVEAYMVQSADPEVSSGAPAVPRGGTALAGTAAVRHAITMATGLDSVVVGEDQVLHQLRQALDRARQTGRLDPSLERLIAVALRAGRRARSWRSGPSTSLADVALARIERQAGPVRDRRVLVVGAGHMGRLAARAAATAGARIAVTSRTPAHARALAAAITGEAGRFDPGPGIAEFVGIIVALAGPWPIEAPTIEALRAAPVVLVDLSVPQALPADAASAMGSRSISADDLAIGGATSEGSVRDDRERLEALVDATAADFMTWLEGRGRRSAAEALVERADHEREEELAALWRRLPDLQQEARDAIDGMTRHLATRLLREPLERLGRDTDGRDERAVRDLFAL